MQLQLKMMERMHLAVVVDDCNQHHDINLIFDENKEIKYMGEKSTVAHRSELLQEFSLRAYPSTN
jgi:hypothetical protein